MVAAGALLCIGLEVAGDAEPEGTMADSEKNAPISTRDEAPQAANREKTVEGSASASQAHVAEEPSGYRGENPSTAGPGGTGIRSATPENARGKIDPSAPGETGITPHTTAGS